MDYVYDKGEAVKVFICLLLLFSFVEGSTFVEAQDELERRSTDFLAPDEFDYSAIDILNQALADESGTFLKLVSSINEINTYFECINRLEIAEIIDPSLAILKGYCRDVDESHWLLFRYKHKGTHFLVEDYTPEYVIDVFDNVVSVRFIDPVDIQRLYNGVNVEVIVHTETEDLPASFIMDLKYFEWEGDFIPFFSISYDQDLSTVTPEDVEITIRRTFQDPTYDNY